MSGCAAGGFTTAAILSRRDYRRPGWILYELCLERLGEPPDLRTGSLEANRIAGQQPLLGWGGEEGGPGRLGCIHRDGSSLLPTPTQLPIAVGGSKAVVVLVRE